MAVVGGWESQSSQRVCLLVLACLGGVGATCVTCLFRLANI